MFRVVQLKNDDDKHFRRLNTHAGLLALAAAGAVLFSHFQHQNSAIPDLERPKDAASITSLQARIGQQWVISPEETFIDDLLTKYGANLAYDNPYNLTAQDLDFAIRLIATEGSPDEPDEGLKGIIDVILNRMKSNYFPNAVTVKSTIAEPGQFDSVYTSNAFPNVGEDDQFSAYSLVGMHPGFTPEYIDRVARITIEKLLQEPVQIDVTRGATFYANNSVTQEQFGLSHIEMLAENGIYVEEAVTLGNHTFERLIPELYPLDYQ